MEDAYEPQPPNGWIDEDWEEDEAMENETEETCALGYVTFQELQTIIRAQVVRVGLQGDDVEDCSIDILLWMLTEGGTKLTRWLSKEKRSRCITKVDAIAWLRVCAKNHARQFRRDTNARRTRELSWRDATLRGWIGEAGVAYLLCKRGKCPTDSDLALCRAEFWGINR